MRSKSEETPTSSSMLLGARTAVLCAVVFASPLIAGRMMAIPALLVQALVLLAAVLWMIRSAREGRVNLPGRTIVASAAVFLALLVLSAWRSASLYLTLRDFLNFAAYLLVFLMVAGSDRKSALFVLASLSVSALVVSALGVREYVLTGSAGWRVFSTFFNPDFLSGFAAMMLPVALAWYLSRTSVGVSAVAGLCAIGLFANILVSGSRFGAVAGVGGIVLFLILSLASGSFKKAQLVRAAILLIPLILVYIALSTPLAARVTATKAESHSGGFRIYTWRGTIHMAEANPIHGTGLGTFEIAYPKYALVGFTKLAHNSYLQLAAEAGPLSLLALVALLGLSAFPPIAALVRKRVNSDGDSSWMPDRALMMCGLLGGVAASMAHNLADSDWYVTAIGIGFWTILGAAVALGVESPRTSGFSRRTEFVFSAVLTVTIVYTIAILAGEICVASGDRAWRSDPEATIASYRLASKLDPLNAEHHRRLASAYRTLAVQPGGVEYVGLAREQLAAAIRLEPDNAKTHYQLGRVSEIQRDYGTMVLVFQTALRLDPNSPKVMLALARAYEASGRPGDALSIWRKLARVEETPYEQIKAVPELVAPEYIFAHQALGREYERRGDPTQAAREYRLALDRAKRYQESVTAMRQILEANNRRDREMENRVAEVQRELTARVKALSR